MSQNRFRRDRGFVAGPLKKGPNGRNLCRWCQTEVPPRRQTFCSSKCVFEWKLRTDAQFVRRQVHARDRGICCRCGLDTDFLAKQLMSLYLLSPEEASENAWLFGFGKAFSSTRRRWGLYPHLRSLWQADHIVPVIEGGGECGLDGYRTLCMPCHKRVTAKLRTRMKQRKSELRGKDVNQIVERSSKPA